MKQLLYSCLAICMAVMTFSSCDKDEDTGNLDINIQLLYDGQPYVQSDVIAYDENLDVFFSRMSFFVSNLTVQSGNSSPYELIDLDYWDIASAQFDANSANIGFTKSFGDVPVATYDQLAFTLGVPPDLNATMPSDHDANSPLSDFAEYWEAWGSFVFVKVEGKADSDGNGDFDTGLAFHIGGDQSLRSLNGPINVQVTGDETATIRMAIDLKKMFETDSGMYDILATPRLHTEELIPVAQQLLNQLLGGFFILS